MDERKFNSASEVWHLKGFEALLFWCSLALCCFTRLFRLDYKAIMHDEALFVYYTWEQLYRAWDYNYLPILHGPSALHLQALVFQLFGDSDYTFRLACALLGVGGFFFVWLLRPWLGAAGIVYAALFYSLAPGITFFQRFFHMDALFLTVSLWIIASLAWWWRSRSGRWLASAVIAAMVLFTNKESSLFVYFSIVTFAVLVVLCDLSQWFFDGKDAKLPTRHFFEKLPRIPGTAWFAAGFALVITVTMVFTFEGLTYQDGEAGTVDALGHDWVLKDIASIPLALGWQQLTPDQATDASPAMSGSGFWRLFYFFLLTGSAVLFFLLRRLAMLRVGHREILVQFWARVHYGRYYLLAAALLSLAWYLFCFTTGLTKDWGFFEIYRKTWAYWGGQHELGRIGGPFHQHSLNLIVYELPSVLVVLIAWLLMPLRNSWARSSAIGFFLVAIAMAGFQKFVFSDLTTPGEAGALVPLAIPYLKVLFALTVASGVVAVFLPRAGRPLMALLPLIVVCYSLAYFNSASWVEARSSLVYKGGEAVMLVNRHVTLADMMEVQFNFDGGWNLALVLVLVVFATFGAWTALEAGRKFEAFCIWWFVTSIGAASYAREAVPQVGVHAMLPIIILASIYADRAWSQFGAGSLRALLISGLGLGVFWNAKADFQLNFRNADDVRERMVYGHTTPDVKHHAQFIREYYNIASAKDDWARNYNDSTAQKSVRIAVESPEVIWPLRWYLRDMFWREVQDPRSAIDEGWDFLFLKFDADRRFPELTEKYHVFRGIAIRFWLPAPLQRDRLLDAWTIWIPGHYLDPSPHASRAFESKSEWKKAWYYLWRRDTFVGGEATRHARASMSGTDYLFCVRKDLY